MIQVIWSKRSVQELEDILEYWTKMNKSYEYSNKIVEALDTAIELIKVYSNSGVETNFKNVKMRLVLNNYYIVYRINETRIDILNFWDCRQDPKTNKYFK